MIRKIMGSVREYKIYMILTPILIILEVAAETYMPFIMTSFIDKLEKGQLENLAGDSLKLLLLALLSLIVGVAGGFTAVMGSSGFAKNLRNDIFKKVQTFSFKEIDKFSSAGILTRLTTDVSRVQQAFQMSTRMAFIAPLTLIFAIFFAYRLNSRLVNVFFVILPIMAVGFVVIIKLAFPYIKKTFAIYDEMNLVVEENLNGIRVVKNFVRADTEMEKFMDKSGKILKYHSTMDRIAQLNRPIMLICVYGTMLLIAFLGARLIVHSGNMEAYGMTTGILTAYITYAMQILMSLMMLTMVIVMMVMSNASAQRVSDMEAYGMTTGILTAYITYAMQILMSLMMLTMVIVMMVMSNASAQRVSEILSQEVGITDPDSPVEALEDGSISFNNVSFSYNHGKNVLENIDLSIASGETVGILGGTGSSKSSLVMLIPRLYDAAAGSVVVGGHNVKTYSLRALRTQVSMVLQKNELFAGTIAENLRWGAPDATDEELLDACAIAQASEFINTLPNGIQTELVQGAANLSGGQRQRLCIARAILKRPRIIIFDDSTSAVDTRTDALIQKGLYESLPGTTKIIIAQRISSVQSADRIVVMDRGRIVDVGTHAELLERCEIYQEVYESQQRKDEEA